MIEESEKSINAAPNTEKTAESSPTGEAGNSLYDQAKAASEVRQAIMASAEFRDLPDTLRGMILSLINLQVTAFQGTPISVEIIKQSIASEIAAALSATSLREAEELAKGSAKKAREDLYGKLAVAEQEELARLDKTLLDLATDFLEREKEITKKTRQLDRDIGEALPGLGTQFSKATAEEFIAAVDELSPEKQKSFAQKYLPEISQLREMHAAQVESLEKTASCLVRKGQILHGLKSTTLEEQMEEVDVRLKADPKNTDLKKHKMNMQNTKQKLSHHTEREQTYGKEQIYLENIIKGITVEKVDHSTIETPHTGIIQENITTATKPIAELAPNEEIILDLCQKEFGHYGISGTTPREFYKNLSQAMQNRTIPLNRDGLAILVELEDMYGDKQQFHSPEQALTEQVQTIFKNGHFPGMHKMVEERIYSMLQADDTITADKIMDKLHLPENISEQQRADFKNTLDDMVSHKDGIIQSRETQRGGVGA